LHSNPRVAFQGRCNIFNHLDWGGNRGAALHLESSRHRFFCKPTPARRQTEGSTQNRAAWPACVAAEEVRLTVYVSDLHRFAPMVDKG